MTSPLICPVCGCVPDISNMTGELSELSASDPGPTPYLYVSLHCPNENGCYVHTTPEWVEYDTPIEEMYGIVVNYWNDLKKHYKKKILFIDTETTGFAPKGADPIKDCEKWPHLVEIAWILTDSEGNELRSDESIIFPEGFTIPAETSAIHGITNEIAIEKGIPLWRVIHDIEPLIRSVDLIVGHNIEFDLGMVISTVKRNGFWPFPIPKSCCTMKSSIDFCAIPSPYGYSNFKYPKLPELYTKLFGTEPDQVHRAMSDISLTKKCFFELVRRGVISWE